MVSPNYLELEDIIIYGTDYGEAAEWFQFSLKGNQVWLLHQSYCKPGTDLAKLEHHKAACETRPLYLSPRLNLQLKSW